MGCRLGLPKNDGGKDGGGDGEGFSQNVTKVLVMGQMLVQRISYVEM